MEERSLTPWERDVIAVLAAVDAEWSATVRDSIPHLVWTSGCPCGCATFSVRDARQPRRLRVPASFSHGTAGAVGLWLQVDADGQAVGVDADNRPGDLPDPATIVVRGAKPSGGVLRFRSDGPEPG